MYPYYDRSYHYYRYPYYNYPAAPFLSNADSIFYQGRVYTRRSGLMQPATWIERGPDGRPYYVKRRSALPSLRQKFAEAINELRQRPSLLNRPPVSSQSPPTQPTAPAPAPTPTRPSSPRPRSSLKQRSQAQPEMAERSRTPAQPPTSQSQPTSQLHQAQHFTPYPFFTPPAHPQLGTENNAYSQQNTATVPTQLAHYAAPHPRMYPYLAPDSQALTTPPTGAPPNTTHIGHNPAAPTIAQPPFSAAIGHGLSNPGQLAMRPAQISPNDLKYKCSICGRFRSSRYQWKHRVPPGQLPGPTICRRCRKEAMDSEDESTDSYEERDYRSHSRARSRLRGRTPGSRSRSRPRSSSRRKRGVDFDYYAYREPEESSSESDESVEGRPQRRKSRSSRARSPSVEIIRFVDGPAAQPRSKSSKRKIIYVEDQRRAEVSDDDEVEVRYVQHAQRSGIVSSRSSTPARRLLTRQHSDPELGTPIVVGRRESYDDPPPIGRIRHVASSRLNAGDPYRHVRSTSKHYRDYPHDRYETRTDEYRYEPAIEQTPRGRIRGRRGRSRSRSRSCHSIDEGAESGPINRYLPAAPSPPPQRRRRFSSLAYADATVDGSAKDGYHETHARTSSRRRRRSDAEPEASEDAGAPADDYDMYDRNGMRVRVREI